jgi:glycylpeptide N-tetradecanoyltransferase
MAEESKPLDVDATKKAAEEALTRDNEESGSEDEGNDAPPTAQSSAAGAAASKKKKSKRKKIKAALTGGDKDPKVTQSNLETAVGSLSKQQMSDLLSLNPALAREVGLKDGEAPTDSAMTRLKALSLQDIMTGLAASGKNAKDMASYKFWQTQPVPKFGENTDLEEEGPFKIIDPEQVPKSPPALMEGFEWVTMDMTQEEQLQEVFELLYGHYVEDEEAMFRFNYSTSFFRWYV